MNRIRGGLLFSALIFCFIAYATEKPSTWQKFKNIFSSKKSDTAQPKQNEQKGQTFFQSIKKLYAQITKFYDFSKEHMTELSLKIKGLRAMQEEGKKRAQKEQLEMPLKRLRADFVMSLIEYLKAAKKVVQGVKIFLQERQSNKAQNFDTLVQTFDKVIEEGDHLVEQLLQGSKAYGLRDDIQKTETKINDYFEKVVKLLSSIKTPIDATQSIINTGMPVLKGINLLAAGSATALVVFAKKLNEGLKMFQLATNVSRDITDLLNNEMAKRAEMLQNDSIKMANDFGKIKEDMQKIEVALEKNESDINNVSKTISKFNAEQQASKSLDYSSEDQSDELVFEDLMPKKK